MEDRAWEGGRFRRAWPGNKSQGDHSKDGYWERVAIIVSKYNTFFPPPIEIVKEGRGCNVWVWGVG